MIWLWIIGYLIGAIITGTIYAKLNPLDTEDTDDDSDRIISVLLAIFWPAVLVTICTGLCLWSAQYLFMLLSKFFYWLAQRMENK